jgi:para-nitrobenzyl esterase
VILLGIAADMTMHEPARFVARSMTHAGKPAWLYRFSYIAEARDNRASGAAHASELPLPVPDGGRGRREGNHRQ